MIEELFCLENNPVYLYKTIEQGIKPDDIEINAGLEPFNITIEEIREIESKVSTKDIKQYNIKGINKALKECFLENYKNQELGGDSFQDLRAKLFKSDISFSDLEDLRKKYEIRRLLREKVSSNNVSDKAYILSENERRKIRDLIIDETINTNKLEEALLKLIELEDSYMETIIDLRYDTGEKAQKKNKELRISKKELISAQESVIKNLLPTENNIPTHHRKN